MQADRQTKTERNARARAHTRTQKDCHGCISLSGCIASFADQNKSTGLAHTHTQNCHGCIALSGCVAPFANQNKSTGLACTKCRGHKITNHIKTNDSQWHKLAHRLYSRTSQRHELPAFNKQTLHPQFGHVQFKMVSTRPEKPIRAPSSLSVASVCRHHLHAS